MNTSNLALKKQKHKPASPPLTHEERFYDLFKLAWFGLHTQFEQTLPDGSVFHSGGKAEIDRSRQLAIRAWNSACFGCEMFQDKTIDEFNSSVKASKEEGQ